MKDSWHSGDPYEYFMGRWSRLITKQFLDWLSPEFGKIWLDVGCGTGALSEAILEIYKPEELIAIDQSEEFVKTVQEKLGNRIESKVGNALDLPIDSNSVSISVSGLVLNFIAEPIKALSEMKRVTKPGGTIAVYVWDYPGIMEFLNCFWDTAAKIDPGALEFHERHRFPNANFESLSKQFKTAGLHNIETTPIEIQTTFDNFDDYWQPFLGGQGPAPTYLLSLNENKRTILRESLFKELATHNDDSISLHSRALAIKAVVK